MDRMLDAQQHVTIRRYRPEDERALILLSQRDSATPPQGERLLAFVDGDLRAAISLIDGRIVADPFAATAGLVELLEARARQLGLRAHGLRGWRPRRRRRLRGPAPQPPGPAVNPELVRRPLV